MALFKLHVPILDDIKTKGWRSALVTTVDQTVERITAGINVGEIRSILRGEAPKRPNPRVKPHADGCEGALQNLCSPGLSLQVGARKRPL